MTHDLRGVEDHELHCRVRALTARSNATLAELLWHLGEVEARGIHRSRACAPLYTYCIYELRMSEDEAYRRAKAARYVRQFPELFEMLARGELHLTGVLMIGPHLGGERHGEILARARFRTKRELSRLVARVDPKPDVPARVEPIGPRPAGAASHAAYVEGLAGPVRELGAGERPGDWFELAAGDDTAGEHGAEPSEGSPCADAPDTAEPLRYKVQFTASQEYVDLLNEAVDLLGNKDLAAVQLCAMKELVRRLRQRRCGASVQDAQRGREAAEAPAPERELGEAAEAPAPARELGEAAEAPAPARQTVQQASPGSPHADQSPAGRVSSRHVPAAVTRGVWARDKGRCAYVDSRGCRCRETSRLELHHRHPYARGGPPTLNNLELRCRAHNLLAAEVDFGRQHMHRVRGSGAELATPSG